MLAFLGWSVVRIWESDIKADVEQCVTVVEEALFDAMLWNDCDDSFTR